MLSTSLWCGLYYFSYCWMPYILLNTFWKYIFQVLSCLVHKHQSLIWPPGFHPNPGLQFQPISSPLLFLLSPLGSFVVLDIFHPLLPQGFHACGSAGIKYFLTSSFLSPSLNLRLQFKGLTPKTPFLFPGIPKVHLVGASLCVITLS